MLPIIIYLCKMIEDKNQSRTNLSELGEFALINHLTKNFKIQHSSSIKGVGDDAAVLNFKNNEVLVTTDLLVEGVHFDLSYMPLKHLGYKAVMVNLSDIYAMNGSASQITVSIAVSNRFTLEALEELYSGIQLACKNHTVDLIGGDTTSSTSGLTISITAMCHVSPNIGAWCGSSCFTRDRIKVTVLTRVCTGSHVTLTALNLARRPRRQHSAKSSTTAQCALFNGGR